MNYSYNLDRKDVVFAQKADINVSFKALVEVCRAIRYMRTSDALVLLDRIAAMERPIAFKRYNKHVGARSELHGRKGRYPVKAAKEVKAVLINALANTRNAGWIEGTDLFVVHSSANKTRIERRYPPRGGYAWGRGTYHSHMMHSNIEYSKIEIGVAEKDAKGLSERMKKLINKNGARKGAPIPAKRQEVKKAKAPKKEEQKDKTQERVNEQPKIEEKNVVNKQKVE